MKRLINYQKGICIIYKMEKEKLNDVVICRGDDTILEVSRILRDTKQRHLIVVDNENEPQGIISTVDINNRVVAEEKNINEVKAEGIMTKPIATIEISASYEDAYQKMIEKGLYSIPVTENKRLIGLLDFNQLFMKAQEHVKNEKS